MQPLIGYTYILYEISPFVNHKMSKKFPLLENFFSYVLVFGDFFQLDCALQPAARPRFRGLWPLKYSLPETCGRSADLRAGDVARSGFFHGGGARAPLRLRFVPGRQ